MKGRVWKIGQLRRSIGHNTPSDITVSQVIVQFDAGWRRSPRVTPSVDCRGDAEWLRQNSKLRGQSPSRGQPLCTLPLRQDYELAIDLAKRIEPETNPAIAKKALKQQLGNALSVALKVRQTLELAWQGREIRLAP